MRSKVSLAGTALLLLSLHNRCNFLVALAEELVDQPFGGRNVGSDEYKWFTSVRSSDDGDFLCSGFLVGKSHAITAAHCVKDLSADQISVQVGYLCRNWDNCRRPHEVVRLKRWDEHESGGDMAILTLDEPVSIDVQPAVPYLGPSFHPRQNYMKNKKKGRQMELVGAGRVGLRKGQSFYVKKTKVVLLEEDACRAQINPSLLTSTVICSVPSNGNPCQGDSGSAVVVPGKEQFAGRDVVMAVHFKGRLNCDSTEASNQPILHFRLEDAAGMIRRVICEGSDAAPEDWCPIKAWAEMLHTLTGHTRTIAAGGLSFNSYGSRLLSSNSDGTNKMWDPLVGGPALATFAHADGVTVRAGRFHPVADYFASGSTDDSVKLWKPNETDAPFKVFNGHDNAVADVSWSPCGTRLASASSDKTIKVWSVVGDDLLATLTEHTRGVRSVSFHPDGTQLASASADDTIKLWNATTNSFNLLQTLTKHTDDVVSISYSPDGMLLASVSGDLTAKVWDVKTGKVRHDFREHTDRIVDVVWSPRGRLVATASQDGTVRVWDTWNGGSSLVVLQHTEGVTSVAWSPDESVLAAGLLSPGNIVIWRITSG